PRGRLGLIDVQGSHRGEGQLHFRGPAQIDGGFADPQLGGDGIDRHAREAALGELAQGGAEDRGVDLRGARPSTGSHAGRRGRVHVDTYSTPYGIVRSHKTGHAWRTIWIRLR